MKHYMTDKIITDIKIAIDGLALLFETTEGDVVARADGDCCSSTWIEHVETPALGYPAAVLSVEQLDLPEVGATDEYECLRLYGLKLVTDKGDIVIDYRNESNGYYGGDLIWPAAEGEYDSFYGGVYGQNVSNQDWVPIGDNGKPVVDNPAD